MKSTLKYFAAALAIVAAASCTKDVPYDENIDIENQPKVEMTFKASIDADTKTALNGKLLEWSAGDRITLYGNGAYKTADGYNVHKGTCTIEESSISSDKTSAAFTGEVASSSDYCALYPADGWNVNTMFDYKYEFKGFDNQIATINSFDPSKHVMAAGTAIDGKRLNFKNICALAKVTIGTDIIYSVKIEGNAKSVGSIGGTYGWKVNKNMCEHSAVSSNLIHSITLRNENGTPLVNGATYYIVLPACTISNYSVSVCDQDGFVIGSKTKASDFIVERSKIYDMGAFDNNNVKPVEILNVSTTSLNLSATTGFDFFTITTNRNWTVTSDASWLSFDTTSGEPCSDFYVKVSANNNTAYTTRTATITVTGEEESKTIFVTQAAAVKPQTYKTVKQVYPNELVNGGKYVIANYGEKTLYWTINSSNKAVLSTLTNSEIRKENVMVFTKTSDSAGLVEHEKNWYGGTSKEGYASQILGTWKSLVNNYTLGETFTFGSGAALYVGMGGRWNSGSTYDIDMYKNPANTFIYRKETSLNIALNTTEAEYHGQGGRKWLIWEVTEE